MYPQLKKMPLLSSQVYTWRALAQILNTHEGPKVNCSQQLLPPSWIYWNVLLKSLLKNKTFNYLHISMDDAQVMEIACG